MILSSVSLVTSISIAEISAARKVETLPSFSLLAMTIICELLAISSFLSSASPNEGNVIPFSGEREDTDVYKRQAISHAL